MQWFERFFNCIYLDLAPGKKTQKKLAEYANNMTFQNVFENLLMRAYARYELDGIEETMDEKTIKQSIMYYAGFGVFEKFGSNLSLPGVRNGGVTLYGYYNAMSVYGKNGYNENIPVYIPGGAENELIRQPRDDIPVIDGTPRGVWIRENEGSYPFINYVIDYAAKISEAYRALDIMRENLKTPWIITAEEELIPTIKKELAKIDNNESRIISSGIFPPDKIAMLELHSPPEAVKIVTDLIEWYYNDFNKLCGMDSNSNPDKAERLLVDEVNASNDATYKTFINTLNFFQKELDFCNEKMGTKFKVMKPKGDEDNGDALQTMDPDAGPGKMADTGGRAATDK